MLLWTDIFNSKLHDFLAVHGSGTKICSGNGDDDDEIVGVDMQQANSRRAGQATN